MKLTPKNWRDFQHYKDRSPPWIRLHRKLLDDRDFHSLPVASRALAPMLWLLASESIDGSINGSPEELAFRLRMSEKEIKLALKPLIDKGFFIQEHGASKVIAPCVPDAEPEALQRQSITETDAFEGAWNAYPKRPGNSRADALKAWSARVKEGHKPEAMTAGVRRYAAFCKAQNTEARFIKLAATFFGPGLHFQDQWQAEVAPITVGSDAAAETAAMLAQQAEHAKRSTAPPASLLALVGKAVRVQ